MSLTAFKRKSVIQYGSDRSGKPPGGIWLPQGPFGSETTALQIAKNTYGNSGFSLNGGHRNVGGVGQDMKMSKSGTPYRGVNPIGWGGTLGTYPSAELVGPFGGAVSNSSKTAVVQPLLNGRFAAVANTQLYIKPSVLSTYGMLRKKYRWAYYGQYPNYWVQPNYTGNQTDSASQWLYIQNKAAANVCKLSVNNVGTYTGDIKATGPTLCTPGRSTAMFTYNDMARNAPYTKTLYQPVSYSQYNLYLTRGCNDPQGVQKPFPFAVTTGSSQAASGTSITSFGSGCNTSNYYLTPPSWYTGYTYTQEFSSNTPSTGKYVLTPITPPRPPNTAEPPQKLPFINE
jgi:hypothetical protein